MDRWVPLGPVGDDYAEKSRDLIRRMGPYSTREIEGNICFGLKITAFKDKTMLHRSKWSSSSNLSHLEDLGGFLPEPARRDIDISEIGPDKLAELPQILDDHEGIKRLERFQRAVFYSSINQMPHVMEEVLLPSFYRWYPDGEWMFATANKNLHIALATLRVLGGVIELADRDYEQLHELGQFKMMIGAQSGGVFYGSKHLSIPLMIFLPVMYGFVASKVTLSFVFLFDEPVMEVREPFPRSGLEFFRTNASSLFRQNLDIDVEDVTPDVIDTFRLIEDEFTKEQVKRFIDEYFHMLNGYVTYLMDPANFMTDSAKWPSLSHYRAWLTFERLTDEITFLLTDDSPYLRKVATFRILDQVSSLMSEHSGDQSQLFRELLLPKDHDPIRGGLERYSGKVAEYLQHQLQVVRDELRDMVLDSVFLPGAYDDDAVVVRPPDADPIKADDYVTGVVRELRNTYHGYHTHQFEKYLLINTGSIPDSLPALAILAYLGLLAAPEMFLTRGWD